MHVCVCIKQMLKIVTSELTVTTPPPPKNNTFIRKYWNSIKHQPWRKWRHGSRDPRSWWQFFYRARVQLATWTARPIKNKEKEEIRKAKSNPGAQGNEWKRRESSGRKDRAGSCLLNVFTWPFITNHLIVLTWCDSAFQSAEEQFKRQLDWCIEQLELGLKLQKATPKQS